MTRKKRDCRLSEAGRERKRSKRGHGGRPRTRAANRVVHAAPSSEATDIERAPTRTRAGVTLPALKCLEKKLIAGEWI
jgi:hypothetical protein